MILKSLEILTVRIPPITPEFRIDGIAQSGVACRPALVRWQISFSEGTELASKII